CPDRFRSTRPSLASLGLRIFVRRTVSVFLALMRTRIASPIARYVAAIGCGPRLADEQHKCETEAQQQRKTCSPQLAHRSLMLINGVNHFHARSIRSCLRAR